jgi:hypothetical protein
VAIKYVEFTEESNALDYLEKAVFFIQTAKNNPLDWKWAMIAIHGALYGFTICTLAGTDAEQNVCDKTKGGYRKLIDFREALKRCQKSEWMNLSGYTKPLKISDKQKRAVLCIHEEFRNQFLHYRPVCWLIELGGMPEIISDALDVIGAVTQDMGSYYTHYDRNQVASLVAAGKQACQAANPPKLHR